MDTPTETPAPPASPSAPERRDEDGLPLDRAPTIDDVRGGANHFKIAIGCTAAVAVLLLVFWVLRIALAR